MAAEAPGRQKPRRVSRVLMTGDTLGGVWDYSLQLASALASEGIAVTLATMGRRATDDQRQAAQGIPGLELRESDYRLEWMQESWDDVDRAGGWLQDLAARVSPDVVHLNGYVHAALPWPAPTLVVGHSCVYSWWAAVHRDVPPPAWRRYHARVAEGLARADAVAAPSRAMLQALAAHYGLRGGRVIPNGREVTPVPAIKQPIVLSAGRLWDPAKNIAALAGVAPDLAWPVYVAGDATGPDGATHLPASVRCLGRLASPDLHRWMAAASIYVLPARYEPFGLSILEAARCGCALVLGDIPSLRENWDGAATFVPPSDAPALRDAIAALIGSEPSRLEMQRRARRRAREFTVDRMARAYLDAYRSLVERARRREDDTRAGAAVPPASPEGSPCAW